MATIEALKSKNVLITAASIVGALAVEQLLERRSKPMPDVVDKLPDSAGDLIDELGRGVTSVAKRASSAIGSDDADEQQETTASVGLEELADRREERHKRREQRRKQS